MQTDPGKTVRITLDGHTDSFGSGVTLDEAVKRLLPPEQAQGVLGAMHGGECVELSQPLDRDGELISLTYRDEEGRRIYERSLRFLCLAAMKRVLPGKRVRVLNSVGHGLYIRVPDEDLNHAQVRAVEAEMLRLREENLPFQREQWDKKDAIAYFEKEGWADKVALLRYRPQRQITMYRMGDLCEYFYGAMLPSTGRVRAFSVKAHFPGLVLMSPAPDAPDVAAPYQAHTKFLRVFTESQRWCGILGANNAADVNRMVREGRMREFIRVNEALHDKSIATIADEIVRRGARIVMIFGPSASGKTTFANRLAPNLYHQQ